VRVLHVSEVTWGGVVSLIRDFTTEQVGRGNEVFLLTPAAFPPLPEPRVQRMDWSIERRRPASWVKALVELRRTIQRVRPDVLHLHSAFAGFLGRLPMVFMTPPLPVVVFQPHAWSFDIFDGGLARRLSEAWERVADRSTAVLVANCTDEIEQGRRHGIHSAGHALGVPIDTERFSPVPDEERDTWRAAAGVTASRAVLCLGRLAQQKGQDLLVRQWERDPIPDAELVLVGPGDPAPLRALAPREWDRSIRWVGEQADVRPYLWACDVLVLPSRYETVAVVVAEAMACERPVVAFAVNGAAMAITDGPWPPGGEVVPQGDVTALLRTARQFLDDEARAKDLGTAGRERVVGTFTPALVVDRLDAAYGAALASTR